MQLEPFLANEFLTQPTLTPLLCLPLRANSTHVKNTMAAYKQEKSFSNMLTQPSNQATFHSSTPPDLNNCTREYVHMPPLLCPLPMSAPRSPGQPPRPAAAGTGPLGARGSGSSRLFVPASPVVVVSACSLPTAFLRRLPPRPPSLPFLLPRGQRLTCRLLPLCSPLPPPQ